jgi:hypothetical protein
MDHSQGGGPITAWNRFWFLPVDPIGLNAVRVLTGVILLYWLVSFMGEQNSFFGLSGWVDETAIREMSRLPAEEIPQPISTNWSLLYLAPNATAVTVIYAAAIMVVGLFTLGFATRITGVLTWLIVASFTANPAISYGGDVLLLILSFYLMIGYLLLDLGPSADGQWHLGTLLGSKRTWIFGKSDESTSVPSVAANVALRLLQVHLAIVVFIAGIHKLQFGVWWSGLSLWFPLHPPFENTLAEILERYPNPNAVMVPLSLASYALLAWQISFPFVIWRPALRPVMLAGAAIGWLGSIFVFHMPIFGPAILIGCLAFVPAASWRRMLAAVVGVKGREAAAVPTSVTDPVESRAKAVAS